MPKATLSVSQIDSRTEIKLKLNFKKIVQKNKKIKMHWLKQKPKTETAKK